VAWRQSNNQWSGGMANTKIHWKISRLGFLGIKTACYSLIIFQRAKLSTRSITHTMLVQLKDILKEKRRGTFAKWGLVLARKCLGSPGTCNPEETGLLWLPVS